jgi:hypothetical protein
MVHALGLEKNYYAAMEHSHAAVLPFVFPGLACPTLLL